MKVAIASEDNRVSGHFGFCEGFKIYQIEDENIINEEFIESPGHKPGLLPTFLSDMNVDIILADGMGERAQVLFNEENIEVVVGAQGNCDDVIQKYIDGELKSTGAICKEEYHEDN